MDAGEVIVAVSGIVVSGLLGPWVTTAIVRSNERRAFQRNRVRDQRDELGELLDEAATLLSRGPRVLRRRVQYPTDADAAAAAGDWSDAVFPMRERLVLRLPATDPVVVSYDQARTAAKRLVKDPTENAIVTAYETARDDFLIAARTALAAPIAET